MVVQPVEKVIAGKYEILEKIREGGMGAIYKVRHRLLDEIRIIKVLRSDLAMDEKLRLRFQNEAKFAIQLRHPNIAHLYDFSVSADGTSAYIVMEYIDGVTLQEMIAESGPPTLGLAVEIASQALQALGYLHTQGFVHRDIASDNLMLTRDFQGRPLVKLIDLGIAKGQDQNLNLTATGIFMGKVRYSAPELFKAEGGAAELDERSDIYSFGILMYELLTGKSPVSGESFSEIVAGHLFRPPLPFEESDPEGEIPDGLRALALKTLEKDPDKRVASCEELLAQLAAFASRDESHTEEFAQAIQATTQLATLKPKADAGGSTQDRLDRQFGVEDPTSGSEELEKRKQEAVAQAASAIRERTRTGELEQAGEDLELAVSLYGEHEELDRVRSELRAGSVADTAPVELDPSKVAKAVAAVDRRPDLLRWLTSPLGLVLTLGVILVGAGLVTVALLSGPAGPKADAADSRELSVELAPRWGDDTVLAPNEGAGPELLGSAPDEPPPVSEEVEPAARRSGPAASAARTPAAASPPADPQAPSAEPSSPPGTVPRQIPSQTAPAQPEVRRGELFAPEPGVSRPELVRLPAPVYPARFDPPDETLEIEVEVLVSEDGHVITGRVASGAPGKRRFKELALETAKAATFRPATKEGVAGKMWTTVRVTLPPG